MNFEIVRYICVHFLGATTPKCIFIVFSYVPGVFGNQQKRYLGVIKNMLLQSLSDASSYKVELFVGTWRNMVRVILVWMFVSCLELPV